jgi:hypothetical protein
MAVGQQKQPEGWFVIGVGCFLLACPSLFVWAPWKTITVADRGCHTNSAGFAVVAGGPGN